MWDSGQTAVPQEGWLSTTVTYGGTTALTSDTSYNWKVRWWASTSTEVSPYSTTARFHVGLLTPTDWMGAASIHADSKQPPPIPPPPPPPHHTCTSQCKMLSTGTSYFHGKIARCAFNIFLSFAYSRVPLGQARTTKHRPTASSRLQRVKRPAWPIQRACKLPGHLTTAISASCTSRSPQQ